MCTYVYESVWVCVCVCVCMYIFSLTHVPTGQMIEPNTVNNLGRDSLNFPGLFMSRVTL